MKMQRRSGCRDGGSCGMVTGSRAPLPTVTKAENRVKEEDEIPEPLDI
jgi:hypothetical protein